MQMSLTITGGPSDMVTLFGLLAKLNLEGLKVSGGAASALPGELADVDEEEIDDDGEETFMKDHVTQVEVVPKKKPGRPAKVKTAISTDVSSAKFKEAAEANPVVAETPAVVEKPAEKPAPKAPAAPAYNAEAHANEIREKMSKLIGTEGIGPKPVVDALKKYGVGKLAQLPSDQYAAFETDIDAIKADFDAKQAANDIL